MTTPRTSFRLPSAEATGLTHRSLPAPHEGAKRELCLIGLRGAENPQEAADGSGQMWWATVGRKPA